jgi:hypothetical protein
MPESKGQVRIEVTPEQRAKVRAASGKDAEAVELSVEELEERIAPLITIKAPGKALSSPQRAHRAAERPK